MRVTLATKTTVTKTKDCGERKEGEGEKWFRNFFLNFYS